jgi:hypothetical protein
MNACVHDVCLVRYAYFVSHISRMDALFESHFATIEESSGRPLSKCGKCRRAMKYIAAKPSRLHCNVCIHCPLQRIPHASPYFTAILCYAFEFCFDRRVIRRTSCLNKASSSCMSLLLQLGPPSFLTECACTCATSLFGAILCARSCVCRYMEKTCPLDDFELILYSTGGECPHVAPSEPVHSMFSSCSCPTSILNSHVSLCSLVLLLFVLGENGMSFLLCPFCYNFSPFEEKTGM